ncbi:MAG: DUF393 domain-containing protein [Bacteroidales bacterium]|nr:DUF393 domain-containing protein [Bacteroidales bacterium]
MEKNRTLNQCAILIDGDCLMCSRTAAYIGRIDKKKKLRILLRSTAHEDIKLEDYPLEILFADSVAFIRGNSAWVKSDAIIQLGLELGGLWKLSIILKLIPKVIRDYIYDMIAANRHRIGKILFKAPPSCSIPNCN